MNARNAMCRLRQLEKTARTFSTLMQPAWRGLTGHWNRQAFTTGLQNDDHATEDLDAQNRNGTKQKWSILYVCTSNEIAVDNPPKQGKTELLSSTQYAFAAA
jgi:hypothetical protein